MIKYGSLGFLVAFVALNACKPREFNSSTKDFSTNQRTEGKVLETISCTQKGHAGSLQFVETVTGVNAIITDGKNDGSGLGYSVHTVALKSVNVAYENDKGTSFSSEIGKGISCEIPEQGDRDIPCYKVSSIGYWMPEENKKASEPLNVSIEYSIEGKATKESFEGCSYVNTSGSASPVCNAMKRKLGDNACRLVD